MFDRLEAAFTRVTRFTSDASHELRTPVALIRTATEVALRRARTGEEYEQVLREIRDETERMSRLVEDLLMLARNDQRAEAFRKEPVDLVALLRETEERLSGVAAARGVRLSVALPAAPVMVVGDEAALSRLLTILSDNALKYTPPPGTVAWRLTSDGSRCTIEVQDSGIGIAAEDLPHVFDRFYRADRARGRDSGGAGLGLSIARTIVEAHGGSIHAACPPSGGCRMTVTLTALDAAAFG